MNNDICSVISDNLLTNFKYTTWRKCSKSSKNTKSKLWLLLLIYLQMISSLKQSIVWLKNILKIKNSVRNYLYDSFFSLAPQTGFIHQPCCDKPAVWTGFIVWCLISSEKNLPERDPVSSRSDVSPEAVQLRRSALCSESVRRDTPLHLQLLLQSVEDFGSLSLSLSLSVCLIKTPTSTCVCVHEWERTHRCHFSS